MTVRRSGAHVLVAGARRLRRSPPPTCCSRLGATVTVTDGDPAALADLADRRRGPRAGARRALPDGCDARRHQPRAAGPTTRWSRPRAAAGCRWSASRSWRGGSARPASARTARRAGSRSPAPTARPPPTAMLEAILRAAGQDAVACGNIGLPVVDALARRAPGAGRGAVELPAALVAVGAPLAAGACSTSPRTTSTGTARWPPTPPRRPGRCAATVAVAGVDDPRGRRAAGRRARRRAGSGSPAASPAPGQLGVVGGHARRPGVRRRRSSSPTIADVAPPGPPGRAERAGRRRAGPRARRGARRRSPPGCARVRPGAAPRRRGRRGGRGHGGSTTPRPPTRTPPPPSLAAHPPRGLGGRRPAQGRRRRRARRRGHRDRLAGAVVLGTDRARDPRRAARDTPPRSPSWTWRG